MAGFIGRARTNYVKVKDIEILKEELETVYGLELIEKEGLCKFNFSGDTAELFNVDDEIDAEPILFKDWFLPHLDEKDICVVIEVGADSDQYFSGYAYAFNHLGDRTSIDINDIYQKAFKAFGINPTKAEY